MCVSVRVRVHAYGCGSGSSSGGACVWRFVQSCSFFVVADFDPLRILAASLCLCLNLCLTRLHLQRIQVPNTNHLVTVLLAPRWLSPCHQEKATPHATSA